MMTMRRTAGTAMPTPMPITKRPTSSGTKSLADGHQQQPDDVERHAAEHELAGVAAVGERGDAATWETNAGEEARSRSPRRAPSSPMPYSSRIVVEHAEQRAVAHGQQRQHEPERDEQRAGARARIPAPYRTPPRLVPAPVRSLVPLSGRRSVRSAVYRARADGLG